MKLICVEEHMMHQEIAKAAHPALEREAPYMMLQSSGKAASRPRDPHCPTLVEMTAALKLGDDLGTGRISEMDEQGLSMQIVSYSSPIQLVPKEQALRMAREANNRLSKKIKANPSRLAGFAMLPWQDPEAAAVELTRAVEELGFKGALIVGRPGDTFLDDPKYSPVLERLNSLKVPLYVHPFHPLPQVQQAYYGRLADEVTTQFSLGGWGWHHEAGIHVLRLLLSGAFDRYPDLQIISGHWGEMVPFFLSRLDQVIPPEVSGFSRKISDIYKSHVWITPSGMYDKAQFEFTLSVMGADRIIWSTDYPFLTMDGTGGFIKSLSVSDKDREKIAYRNAEKLFRL